MNTAAVLGAGAGSAVLHRLPPPGRLHCRVPSLPGRPTGLSCSGLSQERCWAFFFPSVFIQCLRNPLHVIKQITLFFFPLHCQSCSQLIGETFGLCFLLIFLKDSPSSSFFPHLGIVPSLLLRGVAVGN